MSDFVEPKGCKKLSFKTLADQPFLEPILFDASGHMIEHITSNRVTTFCVEREQLSSQFDEYFETEEEAHQRLSKLPDNSKVVQEYDNHYYYKVKDFQLWDLRSNTRCLKKVINPRRRYTISNVYCDLDSPLPYKLSDTFIDCELDHKVIIRNLSVKCNNNTINKVFEIINSWTSKHEVQRISVTLVVSGKTILDISVLNQIERKIDLTIISLGCKRETLISCKKELTNVRYLEFNGEPDGYKTIDNMLKNLECLNPKGLLTYYLNVMAVNDPELTYPNITNLVGCIIGEQKFEKLFPDTVNIRSSYIDRITDSGVEAEVQLFVKIDKIIREQSRQHETVTIKEVSFNKKQAVQSRFSGLTVVFRKAKQPKSARSAYPESKKAKLN